MDVAPMNVKYKVRSRAKFDVHRTTGPLSKNNTGMAALRAGLPIITVYQFNSIYFSSRLIAHGKKVQYRMIKNN